MTYWYGGMMTNTLTFPAWERERWIDVAGNPLIAPLKSSWGGEAIGDPQVVLPGEFDEQWHLFAHYGHLYHFTASDGMHWTLVDDYADWSVGPVSLVCDGAHWYLYCSQYGDEVTITVRVSDDLAHWSDPAPVLLPEFDWEREGPRVQVRNPSAALLPDGRWRLYYCGGTVWFDDCGYEEPKYVGVAEADSPLGPFIKRAEPLLAPAPAQWYRNFGTGGFKVYGYGDGYLGLLNGLYHDEAGRSRSAIDVLLSADGLTWDDAPYNPIVLPGGDGWKAAIVYQLDLRLYEGQLWLYYNARDGWREGREWIGCSRLAWTGLEPRKLWRLPAQPLPLPITPPPAPSHEWRGG